MGNQPSYVWALVLTGVLGMPAVTAFGLYAGARATNRSKRTATLIAGGFAVVWATWIGTSALLAYNGAYEQVPEVTRPWIGVAAGGAFLVALGGARMPGVRAVIEAPGGLARVTWPQSLRVVGVAFVIAMALGSLPPVFALPAGLGDIAVGVAAVFIARRLRRGDYSGAVWFNVLGLLDLVIAVSIGFLASLGPTRILDVSPSTAQIALLPLVLVPTTAVPLAMALHVVSLARLRRVTAADPSARGIRRLSTTTALSDATRPA